MRPARNEGGPSSILAEVIFFAINSISDLEGMGLIKD